MLGRDQHYFSTELSKKNLNLLFERSKTKSDVFTVNIITIRLEILKNAGFRLFVYLPFLLALSIKAFFQSWRRVRNIEKNSEFFEKKIVCMLEIIIILHTGELKNSLNLRCMFVIHIFNKYIKAW